jgi:hypothetical protein
VRLNNISENRILLWCSPGFGLVDVWLPVVRRLKEKDGVIIDFVFPEPSSLRLEDNNSNLFNLSEKFADKVIYRGYSGRWFVAGTLIRASTGIKFNEIDEIISNFAIRLFKGKASKYTLLKLIGKYILKIHRYVARIKEDIEDISLYDINFLNDADGILCDITAEGKLMNKELKDNLKHVQKFSMLHGLAPVWVTPLFDCEKPVLKRLDLTVYTMSNLEENGYIRCFGVTKDNIIHAGIPKHDRDWIEFINNQFPPIKKHLFDSFVFVIGRPASQYNTIERKKKALKDVYNIVCVKYKLKLVVKTHPKESLDGIDGDIYADALGLENYGKDWMYSSSHPFILGKKAIFSISFYSSVALDMLAINKPTIEYLNLEGLDLYDNKNSLRDRHGKPVFQFRYAGLVLGASSGVELEKYVESILSQHEATILPLRSKYKDYFELFDGASKMLANDIYEKITINS